MSKTFYEDSILIKIISSDGTVKTFDDVMERSDIIIKQAEQYLLDNKYAPAHRTNGTGMTQAQRASEKKKQQEKERRRKKAESKKEAKKIIDAAYR